MGTERSTTLEDAYLGWRSADLFPALGTDGVDFSLGRQAVQLGRGFIVNDDGLNLGRGPADGALDRGGAYYLAARHAFDRTAVLRLGGEQGLHGTAAWLKSDNLAQAETELAAATLDYAGEAGLIGLTWVHGLDVNREWADDFLEQRDGMNVYSLRGKATPVSRMPTSPSSMPGRTRMPARKPPGTLRPATPSPTPHGRRA